MNSSLIPPKRVKKKKKKRTKRRRKRSFSESKRTLREFEEVSSIVNGFMKHFNSLYVFFNEI